MNKLKEISKETELKILKYAGVIIAEHGSIVGDRCCQDWSIDEDQIEHPEIGFDKKEQKALSFNYQQWNSDGEDYDEDCLFFGDEMSVSFMLSRAIQLMIKGIELNQSQSKD